MLVSCTHTKKKSEREAMRKATKGIKGGKQIKTKFL
jgi:hypothetical protein